MDRSRPAEGAILPTGSLSLPPPCIPLPGCPVLARSVPAGFPSPAADYYEERLSLDEHLIEHREATFFVRVQGHSMTGFGIHDGDLLVVDRALDPADRSVVIAVVDGQFTVKQLCLLQSGVLLRSGAPGHGDILVSGDQELTIWGVVRWSIHRV
ncbi:MAG: translesion error-prone DNA polymerase V autoproteolytic subunit [Burkholderiales bacterium]|nr:translesion error-prone DNA polymerase V autoproteolytic subunit [Burkholderiales bacterium]